MKWRWLIWLALLLGSASAQTISSTELEAKRYLHACINAVAFAAIDSGMTKPFDGQSCGNPTFDIARFFDGKSNTPAVATSWIEFGSAGLEDFKIEVTDKGGKTWTGSLGHYPKLPPRTPSPLTPQQQAQAQAAAYQVAAQNIARSCVTALEQYKVDSLERPKTEWDGKGCVEAGLAAASSGAAIEKSLITLRPETVEGYQVTVWPKEGEAVTMPEVLTAKPPKEPSPSSPTLPQPLGLVLGCVLALLIGGFTLLLTTFKLPSSRMVGGLGMGLSTLLLATALLFPLDCCATTNDSWLPGIFSALGELARLLLAGTILLIPPRLAYWWGREAWWVSVGNGVLVSVFVLVEVLLGNLSVKGLSDGLQVTFQYALPVLSAALVMWVLWQRLKRGKRPTISS